MNSASSKNEVSKSVDAVGLACGAVSEVFDGSVGAGFGSVATAVVSGSVVLVVVAAVVADVVTILTVVATVDDLVSVNDVFTGIVASFLTTNYPATLLRPNSCKELLKIYRLTILLLFYNQLYVSFLICCPFDIYEECFCR